MASHLIYDDHISTSNYRLLEIPNDILEDIKNSNKLLVIKGKPDAEAVLCTNSQTYSVRLAMSSNTSLLVPPSTNKTTEGEDILAAVASVSSHYELSKIAPRLHTLKEMMNETLYKGEDNEENVDKSKLYSFQTLSHRVQASNEELLEKLREMNAFQLNGYWRILGTEFLTTTLDLLLTSVDAKGWSLNDVDGQILTDELSDYNPSVLEHILRCYGVPHPATPFHWSLDIKKLSIFRATQLLRELLGEQTIALARNKQYEIRNAGTGKDWRQADFVTAWQDAVPAGAPVDAELLFGIAVTVQSGAESFVRYLPASEVKDIPDARDRIRLLFSVRPKWRLEEFEPYLNDLAKDKASLEQLLAKAARPIIQEGVRLYCSRE